jgi:general secretion pathway protein D
MKFVSLISVLLAVSLSAVAQDDVVDFEENEIGTPEEIDTEGLFDDELEPLDEGEIIRPRRPQPSPKITPSAPRFPEPKKIKSPGGPGRKLPTLPGRVPGKNEKLRMDFVQVDIEEVVKYFSERLQKKFIYDPSILNGKITIISPTPVTLEEAWGAFLSALEVRKYVVYPAGPYLKIEKASNARKTPVPIYSKSTPQSDAYITRIVILKYLSVNDIRTAIRNLLSRTGGDVIVHAPTNTLIISDYAYNIRRIVRILNTLDIEGFQEQIEVIELEHASAADVARKVSDFFPQQSSSRSSRSKTTSAASSKKGVVQKVVADERTNSIILLGSERGIEQVKKFIKRIDVPVDGGGGQIHVYRLKNVKAEEISGTLSSLTSGSSNNRRTTSAPRPGSTAAKQGSAVASLLGGEVKITADASTNSLVIQASTRDFEVLKKIIAQLDIRRKQVFIESAILSADIGGNVDAGIGAAGPVGLTSALSRSADSTLGDDGIRRTNKSGFFGAIGNAPTSLESLFANPLALMGMALGFRSGGTFPVSVPDGNGGNTTVKLPLLSAVLRLTATNSNVNVISTPHILATDNEEASIIIGEEIPQTAGTTRDAAGVTQANITRVRVATELTITPQINEADYITLKIKQVVDDVSTRQTIADTFGTNKREMNTTVIVKDVQTIVIGGLMQNRNVVTDTKVPFLGDIPVLGWLFKRQVKEKKKSNFLLFLTPHIIHDTADMNDKFFEKIKERHDFLDEVGMKQEDYKLNFPRLSQKQIDMLDSQYLETVRNLKLEPLEMRTEPSFREVPQQPKVRPMPQPQEPFRMEPAPQLKPAQPSPALETEPEFIPETEPFLIPEAQPLKPSPAPVPGSTSQPGFKPLPQPQFKETLPEPSLKPGKPSPLPTPANGDEIPFIEDEGQAPKLRPLDTPLDERDLIDIPPEDDHTNLQLYPSGKKTI